VRYWIALAFLGVALLASRTLSAQSNWPQFRGPDGQGHAAPDADPPVTWSEQENIAWKTPIHGRGWSSPVVWNDQIWLTTATEDGHEMYAVCIDRADGHVIHDLHLFHKDEPEEIHVTNSYASPTPVIEEGRVYCPFGSYGLACLDTATGERLWERRDLPCNHWRGAGSSPMLFENLLFLHYDGYDFQYIVALDKQTGETVWKKDREIAFLSTDGDMRKAYSTPLLIEAAGRQQLISTCANGALAYNPRNGDVFWKIHFENHSATARPLFDGNLVYINTGFSKADLWAVRPDGAGDVTETHVVWKRDKNVGSQPSQLLVDGLIYLVHDAGVASCIYAATGEEVWIKRLGGNYASSPIYAGGRIYLCSQEGETLVLAPGREFKELATNKLDDGCMASPAAIGKSLFLRTRTHLYRIEASSD
jgi:outer membrane protein assembly factor BamB